MLDGHECASVDSLPTLRVQTDSLAWTAAGPGKAQDVLERMSEDSPLSCPYVLVWIEPPEGWGPTRMLIVQLERLGYHVEEHRYLRGRIVLVIT